jgi:chromosome segregation ATPase
MIVNRRNKKRCPKSTSIKCVNLDTLEIRDNKKRCDNRFRKFCVYNQDEEIFDSLFYNVNNIMNNVFAIKNKNYTDNLLSITNKKTSSLLDDKEYNKKLNNEINQIKSLLSKSGVIFDYDKGTVKISTNNTLNNTNKNKLITELENKVSLVEFENKKLLQEKIDQLSQINEKKSEVENLKKLLDDCKKNKNTEIEKVLNECNTKIDIEKTEQLNKLMNDNKLLENSLKNYENEIKTLNQQISLKIIDNNISTGEIKSELKKLPSDNSLDKKIAMLLDKLNKTENDYNLLILKNTNLATDKDKLEKQLSELQSNNDALKNDINQTKEAEKIVQNSLNKLNQEKDMLVKKLEQQEKEYAEKILNLNEVSIKQGEDLVKNVLKEFQNIIDDSKKIINEKNIENENLKKEIAAQGLNVMFLNTKLEISKEEFEKEVKDLTINYQKQIEEFKTKITEEIKTKDKEIKLLTEQILKLESTKSGEINEQKKLIEEIKIKDEEIKKKEEELNIKIEKINKEVEIINKLKEQIKILEDTKNDKQILEDKIKNLEKENKILKEEQKNLNNNYKKVESENSTLLNKKQELEKNIVDLESSNNKLNSSLNEYKEEVKNLTKKLNEKITELEEKKETSKLDDIKPVEIAINNEEIVKLQKEINILKGKIVVSKKKYEELKKEYDNTKNSINVINKQLENTLIDINNIKIKNKKLTEENAGLVEKTDTNIQTIKDYINKQIILNSLLNDLNQKLLDNETKLKECIEDMKTKKILWKSFDQTKYNKHKDSVKKILNKTEYIKKLNDEKKGASKTSIINILKKDIEKIEDEEKSIIDKINKENDVLKNTNITLKNELEKLNKEYITKSNEYLILKKTIEYEKNTNKNREEQYKNLYNDLLKLLNDEEKKIINNNDNIKTISSRKDIEVYKTIISDIDKIKDIDSERKKKVIRNINELKDIFSNVNDSNEKIEKNENNISDKKLKDVTKELENKINKTNKNISDNITAFNTNKNTINKISEINSNVKSEISNKINDIEKQTGNDNYTNIKTISDNININIDVVNYNPVKPSIDDKPFVTIQDLIKSKENKIKTEKNNIEEIYKLNPEPSSDIKELIEIENKNIKENTKNLNNIKKFIEELQRSTENNKSKDVERIQLQEIVQNIIDDTKKSKLNISPELKKSIQTEINNSNNKKFKEIVNQVIENNQENLIINDNKFVNVVQQVIDSNKKKDYIKDIENTLDNVISELSNTGDKLILNTYLDFIDNLEDKIFNYKKIKNKNLTNNGTENIKNDINNLIDEIKFNLTEFKQQTKTNFSEEKKDNIVKQLEKILKIIELLKKFLGSNEVIIVDEIEKCNSELEKQKKVFHKLKEELNNKNEYIEKIRNIGKEISKKNTSIKPLNTFFEILNNEVTDNFESDKNKILTELNSINLDITKDENYIKLQKNYNDLQNNLKKIKEDYNDSQNNLKKIKEDYKKIKTENDDQKETLNYLEEQCNEEKDALKDELKNEKKILSEKINELNAILKEKETKIESLNTEIKSSSSSKNELTSLKTELKNLEEEKKKIEDDLNICIKQNKNFETNLNIKEKEYKFFENLAVDKQNEVKKKDEEIANKDKEIKKLTNKLDLYNIKASDYITATNELKNSSKKNSKMNDSDSSMLVSSPIEKIVAKKDQEIATKNQEIATKNQEIANRDQEIENRDQEIKSLTEQILKLESTKDEEIDNFFKDDDSKFQIKIKYNIPKTIVDKMKKFVDIPISKKDEYKLPNYLENYFYNIYKIFETDFKNLLKTINLNLTKEKKIYQIKSSFDIIKNKEAINSLKPFKQKIKIDYLENKSNDYFYINLSFNDYNDLIETINTKLKKSTVTFTNESNDNYDPRILFIFYTYLNLNNKENFIECTKEKEGYCKFIKEKNVPYYYKRLYNLKYNTKFPNIFL